MDAEAFKNLREPLGEILVRRESITAVQLEQAIARQAQDHKLLGETLVEMGFLEEADIIAALIIQCGVPYVAVDRYDIAPRVLKLVPEGLVRKFCLLPIEMNEGVLSIAMINPLQRDIIKEIEKLTGLKVAPFIAKKTELDNAIIRYFGGV